MQFKQKSMNLKELEALSVGDYVTGVIKSTGKNGDGVLKHESGIVVFVKGSTMNQKVTAKVTMISHKFAIAIME